MRTISGWLWPSMVNSTNTIQGFVSKLVALGFLKVGEGARALVITEAGKAAVR